MDRFGQARVWQDTGASRASIVFGHYRGLLDVYSSILQEILSNFVSTYAKYSLKVTLELKRNQRSIDRGETNPR